MEALWICFIVFAIGACIGSFLNVVALRAISKESIVLPSSKCPDCGNLIKWYDNIPIFSYLFTFKGKCRNCGKKVSLQYPIVETLTAIIFLATFLAFGFTLKTLSLLVLFSIAIVIMITDIKKEYIFESHAWILIAASVLTSLIINGASNYAKPAIGLIAGFILMEVLAKLSYYLIRKKEAKSEEKAENKETSDNVDDENIDINEYINKNRRAFGDGDTYLAAASGALLGWQYLLVAMFMAIILQALCVLPQFIINLYKQKQFRLIFSLSAFILLAAVYWITSNFADLGFVGAMAFVVVLMFFAIDTITRLKKNVSNQGFSAIPFGPALLVSTFIVLFFGNDILRFLFEHIFI